MRENLSIYSPTNKSCLTLYPYISIARTPCWVTQNFLFFGLFDPRISHDAGQEKKGALALPFEIAFALLSIRSYFFSVFL